MLPLVRRLNQCDLQSSKHQNSESEFYIFPEPPRQENETVNGVQIWTRGCTHKGHDLCEYGPHPQANTLK